MGYSARPTKGTKRGFKLLMETSSYGPDGKRIKTTKAIPTGQFGMHGFRPDMTLQEARAKASILNADKEESRHALRKVSIAEKMRLANLAVAVAVPDEASFLVWCAEEHRISFNGPNKHNSHWLCGKSILAGLKLEPKDYFEQRRKVYRWFEDRSLSVEYLKKVLRFINLYGDYHAGLYKSYFKPIPYPTGKDKQDIANKHRKSGGKSKEAAPLTAEILSVSEDKWANPEHYSWVYLSLWLGLRPEEVDNLKDGSFHRWEETAPDADGDTYPVLVVYQTKLERTVDEASRWKYIALIYPEQQRIPELINSGHFTRPSVAVMRTALGSKNYGRYSGRKGFETLMTKRGQEFQFVSTMLGHQKPDITYQKYMDRKRARYTPPVKKKVG